MCFNSRSRVGSDHHCHCPCHRHGVSIRAPAWGATVLDVIGVCCDLFQFALPRGERPASTSSAFVATCFNSRSRVGSDGGQGTQGSGSLVSIRAPAWGATEYKENLALDFAVSIRAPAWGATVLVICFGVMAGCFNSRSRVGSDKGAPPAGFSAARFNSRSRVGSDPVIFCANNFLECFNSRSRVGSDCHHRMTGTVWLKGALRASLPERYRVINSILYAVYKIIRLFMLLTLSLTSRYFTGNWWLALDNQSIVEDIGCCLRAIMLNFIAPFAAEHIKTQAVCCRLIGLQQFVFKACPLFGIDIAFKYGILHTHAVILTMCGDLPQSFCTACVSKRDIVSNEYQH